MTPWWQWPWEALCHFFAGYLPGKFLAAHRTATMSGITTLLAFLPLPSLSSAATVAWPAARASCLSTPANSIRLAIFHYKQNVTHCLLVLRALPHTTYDTSYAAAAMLAASALTAGGRTKHRWTNSDRASTWTLLKGPCCLLPHDNIAFRTCRYKRRIYLAHTTATPLKNGQTTLPDL